VLEPILVGTIFQVLIAFLINNIFASPESEYPVYWTWWRNMSSFGLPMWPPISITETKQRWREASKRARAGDPTDSADSKLTSRAAEEAGTEIGSTRDERRETGETGNRT
jgi:hypothetical protein